MWKNWNVWLFPEGLVGQVGSWPRDPRPAWAGSMADKGRRRPRTAETAALCVCVCVRARALVGRQWCRDMVSVVAQSCPGKVFVFLAEIKIKMLHIRIERDRTSLSGVKFAHTGPNQFLNLIFIVFFSYYHLVPIHHLCPSNHALLSMSMSPFTFLLNPSIP